jgi:hypothetical protein
MSQKPMLNRDRNVLVVFILFKIGFHVETEAYVPHASYMQCIGYVVIESQSVLYTEIYPTPTLSNKSSVYAPHARECMQSNRRLYALAI